MMGLPRFPPNLKDWAPIGFPPIPKWTLHSNPVNPVDTVIEEELRRKEAKWKAEGYPPGLIDKALKMARNWPEGVVGGPIFRTIPKEAREATTRGLSKMGLEIAQRWIETMRGS